MDSKIEKAQSQKDQEITQEKTVQADEVKIELQQQQLQVIQKENINKIGINQEQDIKSNLIWFIFDKKNENNKEIAYCKLCLVNNIKKEYNMQKSNSSTTNLKKHIEKYHEEEYKKNLEQKNIELSQLLLTKYFKKPKTETISENEQKLIMACITRYICFDMKSLNTYKSEQFRQLIFSIYPLFTFPSYDNFINKNVENLYQSMKQQVINKIKQIKKIALTYDFWTSCQQISYLDVTAHGIDSNFVFQSYTLKMKQVLDRHTSLNIKQYILDILLEYEIDSKKAYYLVSDSAANTVLAAELLEQIHIKCIAHCINNALKKAIFKFSEIVSKVRDMAECFNINQFFKMLQQNLQKNQISQILLKQNLMLPPDLTQLILCQILLQIQKNRLNLFILKPIQVKFILTASEFQMVLQITELLEQFDSITTYMSSQSQIKMSCVYPIYDNIIIQMQEQENDLQYIKDMVVINLTTQLCQQLANYQLIIPNYTQQLANNQLIISQQLANNQLIISQLLANNQVQLGIISQQLANYQHNCVVKLITTKDIKNEIKTEIQNTMEKNYKDNQKYLWKCVFFDGRFKDMQFIDDEELKKEINHYIQNNKKNEPINQKSEELIQYSRVIKQTFGKKYYINKSLKTSCDEEIENYITQQNLDINKDPLVQWRDQINKYPFLSKLAQQYLSTPTSIPSERLFSKEGMLITDLRNRLQGERVDQLLFLSTNFKQYN